MERARVLLIALAATLLGLAALLVLPFLEYFLLAVLLTYALRPLQKRFEDQFGQKITAAGLVVGATIAIILPTLWLVRIVLREGRRFVRRIRRGEITFAEVEQLVFDLSGEEINVRQRMQDALEATGIGTLDGALNIFGTITNLAIGVALTLFLLYYFLKDAEQFDRWLRKTVPFPDHVYDQLCQKLDDVMWAVLASHVLIAVIQGVVAGIGLIVLGIPNAVFWTAVMIILAVLPIIGSFLVWGPAALYLFSIGHSFAGAVLLIYGAIVVSFCDDFLRPLIIDRYTETRLNPAAIIIGILGGVYLMGFIGIFFGPVIIGSLRAVLDIYRQEYVEEGPPQATDAASTAAVPREEPVPTQESQPEPHPDTAGTEE